MQIFGDTAEDGLGGGVMSSIHVHAASVGGSLQASAPGCAKFLYSIELKDLKLCHSAFLEAGVTVKVQGSGKQGAALMTKYPAKRQDAECELDLGKYMLLNYETWLLFLRDDLGRNIQLCDLVLVTGCNLTADWATATFLESSDNASISFAVGDSSIGLAPISLSNSSQYSVYVPHKFGPDSSTLRLPQDNSEPNRNQCIFIRSFRVKKNPIWKLRIIKASSRPHQLDKTDDNMNPVAPASSSTAPSDELELDSDDDIMYDHVSFLDL